MPSGDVHAAITRKLLGSTDGRDVQRLMDSTAKIHGPSHRHDDVHSLNGVMAELAQRGQLTPENILAAQLHIGTDRAFDEIHKRIPLRGAQKQAVKLLISDGIVQLLKPPRRARR